MMYNQPPARVFKRAVTAYESPIIIVYSAQTGGKWLLVGGEDAAPQANYLVSSGYAVWGEPVANSETINVVASAFGPLAEEAAA